MFLRFLKIETELRSINARILMVQCDELEQNVYIIATPGPVKIYISRTPEHSLMPLSSEPPSEATDALF